MNKILKQLLIFVVIVIILILPVFVLAQNPSLDLLEQVGSEKGPYQATSDVTISTVLGTAVNAFLSLLGVIFIGLMVYGGYMWMTARGEEEKAVKAKDIIREAIIGLIIVIGAYAIWAFVFYYVINK